MSIPPRFLDDLRDRLTLSEVIGRRIKITRAGREFKACCPFHNEKSPSFTINDDKQFYHCFGCGAHGDVINFVMQNNNLSFIEALEMLAPEAGMEVPKSSPQAVEQSQREKSLHALLDDAAKFFIQALEDKRQADVRGYLEERRMPPAMVEAFRLGYAPADGRALIGALAAKGYTTAQMMEAGLAKKSERNGEIYGFFRDRLMFPIADRRGRVVAFSARLLPEHIRPLPEGGAKGGKYINSPDTPLFHKGKLLYSEAQARQAAADGEPVIVVEGQMDVIACFGAGYSGAVAPLGTALTEDQILNLWKMIPAEEKLPVLCFDGDAAGRRAAARASAKLLPLLKPYHSARFAFLPEGQDPDSLIRNQGRKEFDAVIESALPLADILWMNHTGGRRFETPESRAGLAGALEAEAAQIPDRAVQQYYRQMFRDRLYKAFGPQNAKGAAQRKGAQNGPNRSGKAQTAPDFAPPPRRPANGGDTLSGLILLATLINHPHIFDVVEESFGQIVMPDQRLEAMRQSMLAVLGDDTTLDSTGLQSHLKEQGYEGQLTQVLHSGIYTHAGFARPDAAPEKILAGWHDTLRFMNKRLIWKELRQAGEVFANDFSKENEQRIIGLHDAGKSE